MLDTSELLKHDTSGLCNAVTLRKSDNALRLRIKVSEGRVDYRHPKVEMYEDPSKRRESVRLLPLTSDTTHTHMSGRDRIHTPKDDDDLSSAYEDRV